MTCRSKRDLSWISTASVSSDIVTSAVPCPGTRDGC